MDDYIYGSKFIDINDGIVTNKYRVELLSIPPPLDMCTQNMIYIQWMYDLWFLIAIK